MNETIISGKEYDELLSLQKLNGHLKQMLCNLLKINGKDVVKIILAIKDGCEFQITKPDFDPAYHIACNMDCERYSIAYSEAEATTTIREIKKIDDFSATL